MDHFEDLPPELTDTDERLRANRPFADGQTLDRVMARAERARSRRLTSLLTTSSAPRTTRRMLAVTMASIAAVVGSTGAAIAVMGGSPIGGSSGGEAQTQVDPNAGNAQYCPPLAQLEAELEQLQEDLDEELAKPPKQQDKKLIAKLRSEIRRVERLIEKCFG